MAALDRFYSRWSLRRSACVTLQSAMAAASSAAILSWRLSRLAAFATPADVVTKLNAAFVAALNSPEVKTRFAALMAEPVASTPEQFGAFMKRELGKYEKVVKASGAKVD